MNQPLESLANDLSNALNASANPRLARELLTAAIGLVRDQPATLDLKIASAALREMREAFSAFAPYRGQRKVTVFGSARTASHDPLYDQARTVSRLLADDGWMIVTGAGPGIMHAAMEGAGRERSFGVNIRLPFEQGANSVIAGDGKLVSMKYFFTRKLMLMKESQAFVSMPGGFGTLDETFELITLTQTGKGAPVPIVFLEVPGYAYWDRVHEFVTTQVIDNGYASKQDTDLYAITEDPVEALRYIRHFYRRYHSVRYVGDWLYIRLLSAPTVAQLTDLNRRFADLCVSGSIVLASAHAGEVADADNIDLPRIRLRFNRQAHGRLRQLINALNDLD